MSSEPRTIEGPGHQIVVGRGLLDHLGEITVRTVPAHRYAIITDSNVGPLYAARVAASLKPSSSAPPDILTVPAGESHKTRESWQLLSDELLSLGHGRDSAIVAVGGGMVGDLAGFVAATFMRGVPVIQVPTTLLAMVDSSIGGKTGVNAPAGKNLIGAFHTPSVVVSDPESLRTLDFRELRAGFAEILKHGVIADATYYAEVTAHLPDLLSERGPGGDAMERVVVRSIEIKSAIVAGDPREESRRKILNFGHTVGHAVEAASGFELLHGEAISVGMVAEAAAGEEVGLTDRGTTEAIRAGLVAAGLPVALDRGIEVERVLEIARADKKAREGEVEYAIPKRIGEMVEAEGRWTTPIPIEVVRSVLAA